jgi:hypothetical protein
MDQNTAVSGPASVYPGIEGFYFLSARGALGYIAADRQTFVTETFPQIDDPDFLEQHPQFIEELHQFTHNLNVLRLRYLESHEPDIELGHVQPAVEHKFPWHCATLVLQKGVLDTLCSNYDALLREGVKDPSEASGDNESLQDIRSIYHGMDDLVNYQDTSSVYHYFPLLFFWPRSMRAGVRDLTPDVETAPMRVLNLMWRPATSGFGDAGTAQGYGSAATVFTVLRDNLKTHGAINRNRRVENRFAVE